MLKTLLPSFRSAIYLLGLFSVSAYSSYMANYAMVYHITAALVSIAAVLLSLYGIYKIYQAKDLNQLDEGFLLALGGTILYTLYKPLIVLYFLIPLFQRTNWLKRLNHNLPMPCTGKGKAKGSLVIALLFLVNDFSREYSVWHQAEWNILPLIGVGLSLIWTLFEWKKIRG